ncbi:MAG: CcdB family protein [Pantoea sp.]|uniref:CcdB family protein n=1 Tax=unclassified Pantoea TaxID=2630326 RepID=UPI0003AC87CD|nr:CcdB family protein [Pantoea sp. AS-PWVM4]ERK18632.1 CcdB toxin protein [Pantoea sp. AS-PWVM4]
MQYRVYKNKNASKFYPLLLDVQSDIIESIDSRIVIPLTPIELYQGKVVQRLNPTLHVEGNDYLMMTHELAGVQLTVLGTEVCSLASQRETIRTALDFIIDGF